MVTWFINAPWAKVICILLVISLCPIPASLRPAHAAAQQTTETQAGGMEPDPCMTAQQDATRDTNKGLWFLAGCAIGITGIIIAYVLEPTAPQSRLIGKSPQWVSVYIDCYQRKGKSVQGNAAVTGCLVGEGVLVVAYLIIIAVAVESEDY